MGGGVNYFIVEHCGFIAGSHGKLHEQSCPVGYTRQSQVE